MSENQPKATSSKSLYLWIFAAIIVAVAGIFAANQITSQKLVKQPNKQKVVEKTTLYLNWIYAGSFAGEITGTEKFAPQNDLQIKVTEGGQGLDPLKLVKDGEFGIASSDEILRAIDVGADYIIVGVVNDDHPSAFVSPKDLGISSPKDFVGKKVGILPFGSTGLVYKSMLKLQGIEPSSIDEVVVYPDMRTFMSGKVNDVQPIFVFDETVTLDEANFPYNMILPKDFGVVFKGPAYFTTKSTLSQNPELVNKFIKSMKEGWEYAAKNPQESIDMLATYSPKISRDRELKLLDRALPYYVSTERKTLTSDSNTWEAFINELVSLGYLKSKLDVSEVLDLSAVDK